MEGSLNATLQETRKAESLSEGMEVVVQVAADGDRSITVTVADEKETQSEENKEQVGSAKVEDAQHVSESVVESFGPIVSSPNGSSDAIKAARVENTLISDIADLELKEEQEEVFLSSEPQEADGVSPVVANHEAEGLDSKGTPSEDNHSDLSSVSGYKGSITTEAVDAIKDAPVAVEKKNILFSVVTDSLLRESEEQPNEDVASKETLETTVPNSDESDKVPLSIIGGTEAIPKETQKSWMPSTYEKVVQESSYASVKESPQQLPNIHNAESTGATVQDKTEVPRSTENPTVVSATQRQQYTSWRSCCGLFEVLRRGNR